MKYCFDGKWVEMLGLTVLKLIEERSMSKFNKLKRMHDPTNDRRGFGTSNSVGG